MQKNKPVAQIHILHILHLISKHLYKSYSHKHYCLNDVRQIGTKDMTYADVYLIVLSSWEQRSFSDQDEQKTPADMARRQ